MKNNKAKSVILLIFIILLFMLLFFCITLIEELKKGETEVEINTSVSDIVEEPVEKNPIKAIIEKYGSLYIEEKGMTIYVEFAKKLFNDNGESNQKYFYSIIDELIPFFEKESFYIIDNKNEIYIYLKYNEAEGFHEIIINEAENFYDVVDGEDYVGVDTAKIVDPVSIVVNEYYLNSLATNGFYFSSIENKLGEGKPLDNGYISYLDGKIKLRKIPTGGVRNIIITQKYNTALTTKITTKNNLKEIKELEPNYAFGNLSKGYLGYRQSDYYIFFYEDETSMYPYSYERNKTFEEILKEYVNNKDLDLFVRDLSKRWMAYDHFEYDSESQSADILYSTRGVHIKINNNNPKGITLYQNYYLTDYTKSLVKKGIIDFEPKVDLVEKTELERRKSN